MEETILTLHPEDKQGVRILKRRYERIKSAILEIIAQEGEITFKDLNIEVAKRVKPEFDGSVPWYVVTVKLDLEARGLVERVLGAEPQRVRAGRSAMVDAESFEESDEFTSTMKLLEDLGTEQNRSAYAKQGVASPMFGVSVANLRLSAKKLGKNRTLAAALWDSGNFDAMALATLIDDPEEISSEELDARAASLNDDHLADFFSTFVSKTCYAVSKMKKWTSSDEEYIKRCGYSLVVALARNAALMDDCTLEAFIPAIEREIHSSPNDAREAMNKALIEIGRRPALHEPASAAAARIGDVEIDSGDSNPRTTNAVDDLRRMG